MLIDDQDFVARQRPTDRDRLARFEPGVGRDNGGFRGAVAVENLPARCGPASHQLRTYSLPAHNKQAETW
jgi:hypothetical protein